MGEQTFWVPDPLCDITSGCCSSTGPWTVTRSSLRMLRRVAAFCRPLRPVLLLVSFPRSWRPVVGVPGLCWMWHGVPFARQWRPAVGVLRLCRLLPGSLDCFCRLCPQAVHNLPRCVSACVRPRCPVPPRVVPNVHHIPFLLTAGLPLVGSRSCCANSPSGLRETPPPPGSSLLIHPWSGPTSPRARSPERTRAERPHERREYSPNTTSTPRGVACSNLDTQLVAKTFRGLEGGGLFGGGGGQGGHAGGSATGSRGVRGPATNWGRSVWLHHPYLLGGPHSGDRSQWFQRSLETHNVS